MVQMAGTEDDEAAGRIGWQGLAREACSGILPGHNIKILLDFVIVYCMYSIIMRTTLN